MLLPKLNIRNKQLSKAGSRLIYLDGFETKSVYQFEFDNEVFIKDIRTFIGTVVYNNTKKNIVN